MARISNEVSVRSRQLLDDHFDDWQQLRELARPPHGWVRAIRVALGMSAAAFRAALGRRGAFSRLVQRYADAFVHMVLHLAVCGYYHSLEQRCCFRLLLTRDRVSSPRPPAPRSGPCARGPSRRAA